MIMMLSKDSLDGILSVVVSQAKAEFESKLNSVILFSSYARGDYDDESDIDIMILADIDYGDVNSYTYRLSDRIYRLEIENGCVLSLCTVPQATYDRFKDSIVMSPMKASFCIVKQCWNNKKGSALLRMANWQCLRFRFKLDY